MSKTTYEATITFNIVAENEDQAWDIATLYAAAHPGTQATVVLVSELGADCGFCGSDMHTDRECPDNAAKR